MLFLEVLSNYSYAIIAHMTIGFVLSFIHGPAREKVRSKDPESYKHILGDNSWLFGSGGMSPADIGALFRLHKYLMSSKSNNIIGFKTHVFFRILIPIYYLSLVWFIASFLMLIGSS